ncbi:MAG: hypothetical protein EXS08_13845 [Planctomycetes bacterium]|nr:hypothetical protein [Planctomycetota bacterium]
MALTLISRAAAAQGEAHPSLPVLRTNEALLDYEVDGVLHKGDWRATPELALDVLDLPRSTRARRVVFRSGIEELACEVAAGQAFDFVVRLEGGGDCMTRVSTRRASARRVRDDGQAYTTLPFELGTDSRIYVRGRIDDSEPLELLFDSGSNQLVLFRSGRAKLKELRLDGQTSSVAAGGTTSQGTSDGHRLELVDLQWPDERVACYDQENGHCDGSSGTTCSRT